LRFAICNWGEGARDSSGGSPQFAIGTFGIGFLARAGSHRRGVSQRAFMRRLRAEDVRCGRGSQWIVYADPTRGMGVIGAMGFHEGSFLREAGEGVRSLRRGDFAKWLAEWEFMIVINEFAPHHPGEDHRNESATSKCVVPSRP